MELNTEFDHGRRADIYIEDITMIDSATGEKVKAHVLNVWADANMANTISVVEGVVSVMQQGIPILYIVITDPRYDAAVVIEEIKAAILCAELNKPTEIKDFRYFRRGPFDNSMDPPLPIFPSGVS